MRIRTSQTLVLTPQGEELIAFNFLSKSVFCCNADAIRLLQNLDDWHDLDSAVKMLPGRNVASKKHQIEQLIGATALITEHSSQASQEQEFLDNWGWGVPAALMHYSLKDCEFLSQDEIEGMQVQKSARTPSPALYCRNEAYPATRALPNSLRDNELLQLMARRRTVRESTAAPLTVDMLADCLFAGMGITGETRNCVCKLPLSMTPSGGARNPFEAYVYARNIDGLEPGFYHYSAIEHSIGKLETTERPLPSELLADQEWADDKPCVVFLVAYLERSMWKYVDPNAYRGVLIEAGHIGQNIMLAATQHGLSACPTAAFNHSTLHRCLGVSSSTHCAMYSLAIGAPVEDTSYKIYQ